MTKINKLILASIMAAILPLLAHGDAAVFMKVENGRTDILTCVPTSDSKVGRTYNCELKSNKLPSCQPHDPNC